MFDTDTIRNEFYEAAATACDVVLKKHLEASRPTTDLFQASNYMVLTSIQLTALRRLNDDAYSKAEKRIDAAQAAHLQVTNVKQYIPSEIIQYIVSLAYDMEYHSGAHHPPQGAKGLAATLQDGTDALYKHSRRGSKFLLSATTLRMKLYDHNHDDREARQSDPLKLRITLDARKCREKETMEIVSQHASRLKSLTLHNQYQLSNCASVLPYLEEFNYLLSDAHFSKSDWTDSQNTVRRSKNINLRAATLPSFFVAEFTESGFLRNIANLHVRIGSVETNSSEWPPLDLLLDTLAQLRKLVSLEFTDLVGLHGYSTHQEISLEMFYGTGCHKRREISSLKRLQLNTYCCQYAERFFREFSACDLEEISFEIYPGEHDISDSSIDALRTTFPRLKRLKVPLNYGFHILKHYDKNEQDGTAWSFPYLEMLDVLDGYGISVRRMDHFINVLRERTSPQARARNVQPLNCLRLSHQTFSKKFYSDAMEIILYNLEQIVPNLILE